MAYEFEALSTSTLKSLAPARTVFFFPVGPLEDHGPHLPLGLDLIEAKKLCSLAAQKLERELEGWTGVIMPATPLGIDSDTTDIALTVRNYILRDWLIDSCRFLKRIGFFHFVCFSGHLGPRQLTAIEDAAKIISRRSPLSYLLRKDPKLTPHATLVSACSALTTIKDIKATPFWPDPSEHGGKRDTSVSLALCPEWTQEITTLPNVERPASRFARLLLRLRRKRRDYWGNPALGSAENGNQIMIGTIDEIFPKLRAVWDGSNPNHIFRSWYSILPPNKSFIKGWALAIMLVAMVWFYLKFLGAVFTNPV